MVFQSMIFDKIEKNSFPIIPDPNTRAQMPGEGRSIDTFQLLDNQQVFSQLTDCQLDPALFFFCFAT